MVPPCAVLMASCHERGGDGEGGGGDGDGGDGEGGASGGDGGDCGTLHCWETTASWQIVSPPPTASLRR